MLRQALRTAGRAATQAARGFATQAGEQGKGGVSGSAQNPSCVQLAAPIPRLDGAGSGVKL